MANITPSPPIPKLRSHIFAAASLDIFTVALSRLSINMKSFPRPWYLMKSIVRDASATTSVARPARVARARAARGVHLRGANARAVSRRSSARVDASRVDVDGARPNARARRRRGARDGRARAPRGERNGGAAREHGARSSDERGARSAATRGGRAGRAERFVSRRFGAHFSDPSRRARHLINFLARFRQSLTRWTRLKAT